MANTFMRSNIFMFAISAAAASSITSCRWSGGKLHVTWAAPENMLSDYYELQVSTEAGGEIYAVYSTAKTEAYLDFLNAKQTVFLKVRAHMAHMPSLGPGSWQKPGRQVQCKTGSVPMRREDAKPSSETFMLEVMRESEYTDDVDYLMNHNSGDVEGDVGFITKTASMGHKPSFLNTTFNNSRFTLYCVEVLKAKFHGTTTTGGDDRYADYLSCNDNGNATDPLCKCDNAIDRSLSTPNGIQLKACKNATTGKACSFDPEVPGFFKDCVCTCSSESLDLSAKYTGMMPTWFNSPKQMGVWYSHPKDSECSELETVGQSRPDGSICTWKRRAEARVLRGHDALQAGWNASKIDFHSFPAMVRQNADVIRKVYNRDAFQSWSCEGQQQSRENLGLVV